jgi:hypothetical protein
LEVYMSSATIQSWTNRAYTTGEQAVNSGVQYARGAGKFISENAQKVAKFVKAVFAKIGNALAAGYNIAVSALREVRNIVIVQGLRAKAFISSHPKETGFIGLAALAVIAATKLWGTKVAPTTKEQVDLGVELAEDKAELKTARRELRDARTVAEEARKASEAAQAAAQAKAAEQGVSKADKDAARMAAEAAAVDYQNKLNAITTASSKVKQLTAQVEADKVAKAQADLRAAAQGK